MTAKLTIPEIIEITQVGADPAATAGKSKLYAKSVGGISQLFMMAGDGTITQMGSQGQGAWSNILNDPLTGGSLTGWTQRTGTWTADGTGFHVDNGVAESYLSWENFPIDFFAGDWAMEADISWTAAGQAVSCDSGFVIDGGPSVVSSGFKRIFMHNSGVSGTLVGWDTFGSGGSSFATSFANNITHRFRVVAMAARGKILIYLDNTLLTQVALVPTAIATRVGIWSNPGHANFSNCRIWQTAMPSIP